VGSKVESYHFPIFLEISKVGKKHPNPFKFIPCWIEEEDFGSLVTNNMSPFDGSRREFALIQFQ
jgi:hypothetical protein